MEEDIQHFLPTYHVSWDTLYYKHDKRFYASNFNPIFLEIIKVLQKNVYLFTQLQFFRAKYSQFLQLRILFFPKSNFVDVDKDYIMMENTVIQKPCSLVDPKLEVSQGNNARKVISEVYAFFVLQCIVNTRRIIKIKCFYPPRILDEH